MSGCVTSDCRLHWGCAGGYTDPNTGCQYLQARWYDPTTGHFLSVDPLVSITGETYSYAEGDPITGEDPTGESEDAEETAGFSGPVTPAVGDSGIPDVSGTWVNEETGKPLGGSASGDGTAIDSSSSESDDPVCFGDTPVGGDGDPLSTGNLGAAEDGSSLLSRLGARLADETGAVGRYGNLGNLAGRADETLADVMRSRGGGASQINQLQTGYGELTLGEISDLAASGNREAIRAIKMAKQAGSQGKGGVLAMDPDVARLMSDSGEFLAVSGAKVPGERFTTLVLRFANGTLLLTCDDDTDEIAVRVGELPGGDPSGEVAALAGLLGMIVDYAWVLRNHRGYTDAFQRRLVDGSGREETRQFEVAASAMDVWRVES